MRIFWGSHASSHNSQSASVFGPTIEFLWANLSLGRSIEAMFVTVQTWRTSFALQSTALFSVVGYISRFYVCQLNLAKFCYILQYFIRKCISSKSYQKLSIFFFPPPPTRKGWKKKVRNKTRNSPPKTYEYIYVVLPGFPSSGTVR